MIEFIQQYTDLFIWIIGVTIFTCGYYVGHYYGHQQGFVRGRVAGRKHPSMRNS
jgi:hypothetical protein